MYSAHTQTDDRDSTYSERIDPDSSMSLASFINVRGIEILAKAK